MCCCRRTVRANLIGYAIKSALWQTLFGYANRNVALREAKQTMGDL